MARKTHRLSTTISIAPFSAGSTVGKMKLYRKVLKCEVTPLEDTAGIGRFNSPIPATRRISTRF